MPGTVVFINNNFRLEARIQWGKTHVSKTVSFYRVGDPKDGPHRGFLAQNGGNLKIPLSESFLIEF